MAEPRAIIAFCARELGRFRVPLIKTIARERPNRALEFADLDVNSHDLLVRFLAAADRDS